MAAWSASGVPPQAYCAPALSNGNQAGCVHLSKERNGCPDTGPARHSAWGAKKVGEVPCRDGHTFFAFLHTTCRVRKHNTTAQALGPAAAPADYLQVISASCRNNMPPKLQKSPGERSGVHKTVNSHRSLNCGGCSCILSPLCDSMEPNRPTNRYLGSKLI